MVKPANLLLFIFTAAILSAAIIYPQQKGDFLTNAMDTTVSPGTRFL